MLESAVPFSKLGRFTLTAEQMKPDLENLRQEILGDDDDNPFPRKRQGKARESLQLEIPPLLRAANDPFTVKKRLREMFDVSRFKYFMPFIFAYIAAGYMPSVFMPSFGAKWFASEGEKCEEGKGSSSTTLTPQTTEEGCQFDFVAYNYYATLFLSMRGIISFCFTGKY